VEDEGHITEEVRRSGMMSEAARDLSSGGLAVTTISQQNSETDA